MKKYLIWFLTTVTLVGCSFGSFNSSILGQLSHAQEDHFKLKGSSGHTFNLKTLSSLRQQVFLVLKDSIVLNKAGSFFALEACSIEDGSYFGRFWNNKFDVRYQKKIGSEIEIFTKFDTSQKVLNFFYDAKTKHMCSLIEKWDTNAIKKMSGESRVLGGLNFFASFISNEGGEFKIECLSFYEFSFEINSR